MVRESPDVPRPLTLHQRPGSWTRLPMARLRETANASARATPEPRLTSSKAAEWLWRIRFLASDTPMRASMPGTATWRLRSACPCPAPVAAQDAGESGGSASRMNTELLDHEPPEQRHGLGNWALDAVVMTCQGMLLDEHVTRRRAVQRTGYPDDHDVQGRLHDRGRGHDEIVHGRGARQRPSCLGVADAFSHRRQIAEGLIALRHVTQERREAWASSPEPASNVLPWPSAERIRPTVSCARRTSCHSMPARRRRGTSRFDPLRVKRGTGPGSASRPLPAPARPVRDPARRGDARVPAARRRALPVARSCRRATSTSR